MIMKRRFKSLWVLATGLLCATAPLAANDNEGNFYSRENHSRSYRSATPPLDDDAFEKESGHRKLTAEQNKNAASTQTGDPVKIDRETQTDRGELRRRYCPYYHPRKNFAAQQAKWRRESFGCPQDDVEPVETFLASLRDDATYTKSN
jgi:hypothetical protein